MKKNRFLHKVIVYSISLCIVGAGVTGFIPIVKEMGYTYKTIMEKPVIYVANEAFRIEPLLVTPAVAAPMVLVFLIHLMVKYREPPKKKEGASDHGT